MNGNYRLLMWTAVLSLPSIALLSSSYVVSSTWERVRTKPTPRSIEVTGSASKRIVSDLIEWEADVETQDSDRTAAARALRGHVDTAVEYLVGQGIKREEVRASAVTTYEIVEQETVGSGDERISRRVSRGWSARQSISVRSTDIATVERVSREITALLEKGVPISSREPTYHYTKLGEVKVDLLAAAAANARERAEKIVESGGGQHLGKMLNADMGVININPANSTATSWEGNNDKSSLEKDIITIVHLTFEL